MSATYLSSGNPCLDFFSQVVPNTPSETIVQRLDLAWQYHPLTTLKLICNLRGVRNTGKTDKEGFYTSALWLHKHHPRTLACNLKYMVDFGYFKDLPEILFRLLQGPAARKTADGRPPRRRSHRFEWLKNKKGKKYYQKVGEPLKRSYKRRKLGGGAMGNWGGNRLSGRAFNFESRSGRHRSGRHTDTGKAPFQEKRDAIEKAKRERDMTIEALRAKRAASREKRLEAENMKVMIAKEKASDLRKEKKVDLAKKAVERYARDPDYRFMHDSVSEVFAERLAMDLEALKSGKVGKIGYASKWCPSLGSAFDKSTLLCESIARKVFPREKFPEYQGVEEAHYVYRVRDHLRKEVLVPLRQALELPETYMNVNEWNSLPYNRVPSVAMTKYKKHFIKHDEERFKGFLGKVKKGEAKVSAGALLPHDIIAEALTQYGDSAEVAELQWKRMVQDLLEKGQLRNCLAVCDVSGSMSGTPMDVCVALGLLISELGEDPWKGSVIGLLLSELSEDPWKGSVMTFHSNPQLHKVQGDDLRSKTAFIKRMKWGANTAFQLVFDRILQVAVNGNLSKDQMIKKIFVFSDMEFDAASGRHNYYGAGYYSTCNSWNTDYEVIEKKFVDAGYDVPQIVFWNLRESKSVPVTADTKGLALISGFSKNMVTLFLNEDEQMMLSGPEYVMQAAISGPEYSKLVVLD